MSEAIFIPFVTILLAEFFDKSQLSLFLLATRTKHHLQLLCGALIAFFIVDGLAIILGSFLGTLLPPEVLKVLSGVVFILFGLIAFFQKDSGEVSEPKSAKHIFLSTIGLIFIAEMGDKTQLITGVFATRYPPLAVFIGVMLAFTLLSIVAIYSGKLLANKVNKTLLQKISGVVFILLGLFFLVS